MAKIPFSIKFRPQIESGEYKVETRDGKPSRILCWDRRGERSLVVLVQQPLGYDDVLYYYESGLADGVGRESDEDLFIVTPEPEMTEFEKAVDAIYESCNVKELRVKDKAAELLSLAEKEIAKRHEHYVCIPEDAYCEQLYRQWEEGYDKGKAEALKDLPRWRKAIGYIPQLCLRHESNTGNYTLDMAQSGDMYIAIIDLINLPKEGGHE